MLGGKLLRRTGIVTLCLFMFFTFTADLAWAQKEEDSLLKAREMYQQGDYEGSIGLLSQFIEKLKAMVAQKKNVAEAFYLLAKIYFEVGDDAKVEENLVKVFQTFPSFEAEESNFSFKERVDKVKAKVMEGSEQVKPATVEKENFDEPKPEKTEPQVIQQPSVKKKKKFPILLVVGAAAVITILAVLLLKKKKSDEYDIRGSWGLNISFLGDNFSTGITYSGSISSGTFVDSDGDRGTYSVTGRTVSFSYNAVAINFTGSFSTKDAMNGQVELEGFTGSWTATRGAAGTMTQNFASIKAQHRK